MSSNDPYGIKTFKQREKEEKERVERNTELLNELIKEIKNIGVRLDKIEQKLE